MVKAGTLVYLAALGLLLAWDVYASEYMIRVWGIAHEGNPLMVAAVSHGWQAVAGAKLAGFIPFAGLALLRSGSRVSVWGLRLTTAAYAALGFWHCYGLAVATFPLGG